ncbi:uncharacterized protein LOC129582366 [Paramacrobiotus metropolitanus]|uniref:uncharacterized protein LOC129582366 n=1 Tax=Paramacrobiotus metropolitanus TaxID=2943436 RepID=UPI002445F5E4|nr:uncharacterized protein LOC129582366 [Paramacrobiotus metropolitanus]
MFVLFRVTRKMKTLLRKLTWKHQPGRPTMLSYLWVSIISILLPLSHTAAARVRPVACVTATRALPNDTCQSLADRHGARVDELTALNPHLNCSHLPAGSCVCLADCMVCGVSVYDMDTCQRPAPRPRLPGEPQKMDNRRRTLQH